MACSGVHTGDGMRAAQVQEHTTGLNQDWGKITNLYLRPAFCKMSGKIDVFFNFHLLSVAIFLETVLFIEIFK